MCLATFDANGLGRMTCKLYGVESFQAGQIEDAKCLEGTFGDIRNGLENPSELDFIAFDLFADRVTVVHQVDVVRDPRPEPLNDLSLSLYDVTVHALLLLAFESRLISNGQTSPRSSRRA